MKPITVFLLLLFSSICFAAPHQTITYYNENDTIVREYTVHVPKTYDATKPCGLLVFLHELTGKIDNHATMAQDFADKYGWVIAMPQSLSYINIPIDSLNKMIPGGLPSGIENVLGITVWNSGMKAETLIEPIAEALETYIEDEMALLGALLILESEFEKWTSTDDEGFIIDMLEKVKQDYAVSPDSIYVSGMSMGGFMTHKMLINKGQYFKAGVPVSGLIGDDLMDSYPAHGTHPRVMHIHGTNDDVVGYNGVSGLYGFTAKVGLGVDETINYWRTYNQCDTTAVVSYYPDLKADGMTFERYDYNNGLNNSCVAFIKVNNGRHEWYGATENKDINYMEEIYQFCANKQSGTGPTTNIESISNEMPLLPRKVMNNGKIVIINGGHSYDLLGQPLK